jgi:hypothetical protein
LTDADTGTEERGRLYLARIPSSSFGRPYATLRPGTIGTMDAALVALAAQMNARLGDYIEVVSVSDFVVDIERVKAALPGVVVGIEHSQHGVKLRMADGQQASVSLLNSYLRRAQARDGQRAGGDAEAGSRAASREPAKVIPRWTPQNRPFLSDRVHLALGKDAPDHRPNEPAGLGKVVALPRLGGLHHRYSRRAA